MLTIIANQMAGSFDIQNMQLNSIIIPSLQMRKLKHKTTKDVSKATLQVWAGILTQVSHLQNVLLTAWYIAFPGKSYHRDPFWKGKVQVPVTF